MTWPLLIQVCKRTTKLPSKGSTNQSITIKVKLNSSIISFSLFTLNYSSTFITSIQSFSNLSTTYNLLWSYLPNAIIICYYFHHYFQDNLSFIYNQPSIDCVLEDSKELSRKSKSTYHLSYQPIKRNFRNTLIS